MLQDTDYSLLSYVCEIGNINVRNMAVKTLRGALEHDHTFLSFSRQESIRQIVIALNQMFLQGEPGLQESILNVFEQFVNRMHHNFIYFQDFEILEQLSRYMRQSDKAHNRIYSLFNQFAASVITHGLSIELMDYFEDVCRVDFTSIPQDTP